MVQLPVRLSCWVREGIPWPDGCGLSGSVSGGCRLLGSMVEVMLGVLVPAREFVIPVVVAVAGVWDVVSWFCMG